MSSSNSSHHVYLSYVQSDEVHARKFRELLEQLNVPVSSCRECDTSDEVKAHAESALTHCSIVVVLIGGHTRESRWVDMEIALATEPRIGQPGAGLLGIILEDHADFHQPYYEPGNIPLRLHDRARWEYAIVKKWSEDPQRIQQWLGDAERRRWHMRSAPEVSTILALRGFQWNDSIDTPRPVLQILKEQDE